MHLPLSMSNIPFSAACQPAGRFTDRFARRFGTRALLVLALVFSLGTVSMAASAAPLDSMIKAVKFNDVDSVKSLLAKGMDPNSVDNQGTPMIVIAAREKSTEVALSLMQDKHTDINKTDPAGENAMMLAALMQDAPLVDALIAKGAEVNKAGWTPLHYAASAGYDAIVTTLLNASAYIDAGSPNGTTPLMMAARAGHATTINLLLAQGADPSLKNQIGMTALDFAKRYKEPDGINALTGKAEAWTAQHEAHGTNAAVVGTPVAPAAASAP